LSVCTVITRVRRSPLDFFFGVHLAGWRHTSWQV